MTVPALAVPMLAAAGLIALAGAQKLLDPTMTVGALRAMRLPVPPWLVRFGAGAEAVLGVAAVAIGGTVVWALVAVSYAGFAAFVVAAMTKGTMVSTCGCFGRDETAPHWTHVAINGILSVVSAVGALRYPESIAEGLIDRPGDALALSGCAALTTYLLYAAMVDLPRLLGEVRRVSRS